MSPPASTAAVLRIPPVTCSRGSTAPEPDAEGRSECSTGRLIFAMLFGPFPTLRVEAVYDVIGEGGRRRSELRRPVGRGELLGIPAIGRPAPGGVNFFRMQDGRLAK